MKSPSLALRLARVGVPLLALLAACGNPTINPSGGTPPTATPAGASAGATPYRIGLLASLTGPYADRGIAARDAVQLAAKEVNANGGIGRRPVDLLVEDDQGDASQAVVALKHIIDQDAVAVVGPATGATAVAVLPVEDAAKLPAMSVTGDQSQSQPVHPYVFVAAPPPSLLAADLLSYLQQVNVHHFAVIREASAYGSAGIQQLQQQGGKLGLSVIADETYQVTDTDMTRQLNNVKNNPAVEALVVWASPGVTAGIVTRQFRQLGLAVPLLLTADQADPAYLRAAGGSADGALLEGDKLALDKYLLPGDPSQQPLAHFIMAYKRATGRDPDRFAAIAYDGFNMVVQALERAGADSDHLVAELEKTSFNGIVGPYAFSPSEHAGMRPSALAMATVQGGEFVPVKPNCTGCARTTVTNE